MTRRADLYDPLAALSERVDYLQGSWATTDALALSRECTDARLRSVRWIRGIGVVDKASSAKTTVAKPEPSGAWLPPTADLIAGMHGHSGLAYQITCLNGRIHVHAGVWSSRPDAGDIERRQQTLLALMRTCYLDVRDDQEGEALAFPDRGGYVIGVPAPAEPSTDDPFVPWDRLLRGVSRGAWSVVVVAQAIPEVRRLELRDQFLTEARTIRDIERGGEGGHPLAQAYLESLKKAIETITHAGAVGTWRVGVYLLGDSSSYPLLSAAWKGVFGGSHSVIMPVRVVQSAHAVDLARSWSLVDLPGPAAPGQFRYPFAAQTVLTSHQVAAYIHLPEQEHPGYSVDQVPIFDSSPVDVSLGSDRGLALGNVVDRGRVTDTRYTVDSASLTRHAFVCGVTRSGKTNTILTLLENATEQGAHFLVLEPAKTEYRSLLRIPHLQSGLRVFTAGDETIAPLRVNPLEVPVGTAIATHLDLVRSLFTAAFALWSPLPQIVEQALHQAYRDRGWDVTANTNARVDGTHDRESSFPTLSDLADRAEAVVRESGYDPEATGRIRGALSTAIGGLRAGGKGRMFDAGVSINAEELFDGRVVIELEPLGDENDKAFLMGLILIRLAEHRRAQGESPKLRHLLVIEEAHRLLSSRGGGGEHDRTAGAGEKAIETFTNLLAEVAAYGQGLVIADQVPSRLAPEVLKNTNLKVVHRIVADDDRAAVGATMVMSSLQSRALATLTQGHAAVFAEGEDAPLLIKVAPARAKSLGDVPPPDATELRMLARSAADRSATTSPCCGSEDPGVCQAARDAAAAPDLRSLLGRFAVTVAALPEVSARLWPDLSIEIEQALPPPYLANGASQARRCLLWHGADIYARKRGAQRAWTYADTHAYRQALYEALLEAAGRGAAEEPSASTRLSDMSRRLYLRTREPFPRCNDICPDRTCLFRWPVTDALADTARADPLRAVIAGAGPEVGNAAAAVASWICATPQSNWTESEAERGREVFGRVARCTAQLAVARYRPWPSSREHIDVALAVVAQAEAAAKEEA